MNAPANKGKRYHAEPLTAAECRALLRHCGRGLTGIRNRAIIAVLWRAGLRASEALSIAPKDVDVRASTIRILKGKGGKARTVGLDPEALEFIERWSTERHRRGFPRKAPLFCTLNGRPLGTAYLRRLLPRLATRAGIEKRVHPHGLRHTFARELSDSRVPLRTIQGALGHEHAHTTSTYLGKVAAPEVVEVMRSRVWEPSPETGGLQGALALPETRSATSETHGAPPGRTPPRPDGPEARARVLALALEPKVPSRSKR